MPSKAKKARQPQFDEIPSSDSDAEDNFSIRAGKKEKY